MTPSAADVISALVDRGTWESWDEPIRHATGDSYALQRQRAAAQSGADESVVTGAGAVAGMRAALVVGEFGFLAGSVGHSATDRIIGAFDRASDEGLPVIAAPVSGGTRIQEGTPAFLRMAGIAAAVADHSAAGLPFLVLLRGPTTGGVFATWGSLGHVTAAEPGALVGFLGPRVFAEVMGAPFPANVQTAENLLLHGVIDAVVAVADWKAFAVRFLAVAAARLGDRPHWAPDRSTQPAKPRRPVEAPPPPRAPDHPDRSAWESVVATRRADRPGASQLLDGLTSNVTNLAGTGAGERAAGLIVQLAMLGDSGAVVVAQDRDAQRRGELIGPGSLRTARRAMRLASDLGLPLVTVIDTPGGELSVEAEQGALAGEIARCLADLARITVPTVSVLLGQGTGGAAIALLPCDRVIAAEHSWVTPLPPEGAAAILHRDAGLAPQLAAEQRITSAALAVIGAVDVILPERGEWLAALGEAIKAAVGDLASLVQPSGHLTAAQLHSRTVRWQGGSTDAAWIKQSVAERKR